MIVNEVTTDRGAFLDQEFHLHVGGSPFDHRVYLNFHEAALPVEQDDPQHVTPELISSNSRFSPSPIHLKGGVRANQFELVVPIAALRE